MMSELASVAAVEPLLRLVRIARQCQHDAPGAVVDLAARALERIPLDHVCAHKQLVKVLGDELMKLDPGSKVAIDALKRIALALFRSDKILLRRSGVELIGELSRSLVFAYVVPKAEVAEWLESERVLESLLVTKPDDRVLPMAEDVLASLKMTTADVDCLLARPGSLAVQALVQASIHNAAFNEAAVEYMLQVCAAKVLSDAGHRSFLLACLGNRSTLGALQRKGVSCASAVVDAILLVLVVGRPSADETEILFTALRCDF